MSNPIVQINVSITAAPTPSLLQKTGALISQGATTLAPGTKSLLTQASDLTANKQVAKAITTITWSGSVATVTTAAAHGIPVGDVIQATIAGMTPAGYNGTFACTSTGASTFTYPLVSNPGAQTVAGTWIPVGVAELQSMVTTFFAQGSQQSVYVLELGIGGTATGVTALSTFIAANPGTFYAYLVPAGWSSESTFLTFAATFQAATAKTYFFTTMTLGNYSTWLPTQKAIVGMVPAPGAPATEFSHASDFRVALNYNPTSTNKLTPFAYSYLLGVTNYPISGNVTTLASLLAANVNYVGTGAEGGISNAILFNGTTMDGKAFNYWYAIDWVQINVDRALAALVINGSNNPQNPLYYNQDGINRGQSQIASTMSQAVAGGMVLGTPVQVAMNPSDFVAAVAAGTFANQTAINAQPFIAYSIANPTHYAQGLYQGYQIAMIPQQGFQQIVVNLSVSLFVATS